MISAARSAKPDMVSISVPSRSNITARTTPGMADAVRLMPDRVPRPQRRVKARCFDAAGCRSCVLFCDHAELGTDAEELPQRRERDERIGERRRELGVSCPLRAEHR